MKKNRIKNRDIREYLLREELQKLLDKNYNINNNIKLEVSNVRELIQIFNFKCSECYEIVLKTTTGEKLIYNSKLKNLRIDIMLISLNYIKEHLNRLIKIEEFFNNFFELRKNK